MTGPAFERVTAALVAKTGYQSRNGSWRCPGPTHAHGDQKPSLSVTDSPDGVLLKCQGGCETRDVLAAINLNLSDLYNDPQRKEEDRRQIAATYDYTDETGRLLFQAVRYSPKAFAQRRPDPDRPGKWVWNLTGVRRPLYRLPEVLAGLAADRTVFVVEGEKDVDALFKAGKIATCNPMGAEKWLPEHTETLAGATEIIVWADKDPRGWRHARQVYQALHGQVHAVKVVEARGQYKDAAELLGAGKSPDDHGEITADLDRLCGDQPPPQEPQAEPSSADDGEPVTGGALRGAQIQAQLLTPDDIDQLPDPTWLIDGYIPAGALVAIYGRPGSYKTFVALDWACSVVSGTWWIGHQVVQGPSLYVMAEGSGGLRKRKQAWEEGHSVYLKNTPLRVYPKAVNLLDPEWAAGVAIAAETLGAALTVIDTVARCFPGGEENKSGDMSKLIAAADLIRERSGGTVLLVHHTPIETNRLRGHSSLEGALDTAIAVEYDGTTIKLAVAKQKDDKPQPELLLHPKTAKHSIIIQPGANPDTSPPPDKVLDTLRALAEIELEGGVSSSQWLKALSSSTSESTFYRHRKRLIDDGYCQTISGKEGSANARYGLTDQGKDTLYS